MTAEQRGALDAIRSRFDQMGATARLLAHDSGNSADMTDAMLGLGESLLALCDKMDAILEPRQSEGGQ